MKRPVWLLDSEPREVQLEALRRSYYGYALKDSKDAEDNYRPLRDGPAVGWNHYMEMRLGKTPTTINEGELFIQDYGLERMFILCPNSFKQGWIEEASKSGATLPWMAWDSDRFKDAFKFAEQTKGRFGIAMNYEALKSDNAKQFLSKYVDRRTFMANDESIKLKDHQSIQTKLALSFAKEAGVVRNLSGLPMTQGPQDLYPQFRAVRQLGGLNFFAYRNIVCKMGGFKAKKVVGVRDPERLQGWLDLCSFVAKRKDWGTPLKPDYYVERLAMTPAQKEHYVLMDAEMTSILESGVEISVDMIVTKLMKLQQISSGFIYDETGRAHKIEDPRKTPKMARLLDMMDETRKMIVVYNYGESGDALLECLKQWNPAIVRGDMWMRQNGRNVDEEKKRFNNDDECRVMILQTTSGKYGHDLSGIEGNRCETMVFYENTYSLDDRTQIEARNTSAFQNWTNSYHDFACSPVEMNAVRSLAMKEDIVAAVLGSYRVEEEEAAK